ncbi:MAG: hypothetical protein U0840_11525 [Gemmataceae bacterium]
MSRTIRATLATGMLLLVLPFVVNAADEEMVDNPQYEVWAKFKPGATATVKEVTTFGSDKSIPDEKRITYTLVSVDNQKAIVRAVVVENELLGTVESAPTRHIYPAKLKKSYLAVAAPDLADKKGEETIKWKDKEVACKTMSGSYKKGGDTVEFKAWLSEAIPGGVVKRTRTLKGKEDTITTTISLVSYRTESAEKKK